MQFKLLAKIIKIHGKSTSPAFKDVKIGDEIFFTCDLKGSYHRGATYISCHNRRTDCYTNLSFNQLQWILDKFDFEVLSNGGESEFQYLEKVNCSDCNESVVALSPTQS